MDTDLDVHGEYGSSLDITAEEELKKMGQLPQPIDDSKNLGEWRPEINYVNKWTLGGLPHTWITKIDSISGLYKPLDWRAVLHPWVIWETGCDFPLYLSPSPRNKKQKLQEQ